MKKQRTERQNEHFASFLTKKDFVDDRTGDAQSLSRTKNPQRTGSGPATSREEPETGSSIFNGNKSKRNQIIDSTKLQPVKIPSSGLVENPVNETVLAFGKKASEDGTGFTYLEPTQCSSPRSRIFSAQPDDNKASSAGQRNSGEGSRHTYQRHQNYKGDIGSPQDYRCALNIDLKGPSFPRVKFQRVMNFSEGQNSFESANIQSRQPIVQSPRATFHPPQINPQLLTSYQELQKRLLEQENRTNLLQNINQYRQKVKCARPYLTSEEEKQLGDANQQHKRSQRSQRISRNILEHRQEYAVAQTNTLVRQSKAEGYPYIRVPLKVTVEKLSRKLQPNTQMFNATTEISNKSEKISGLNQILQKSKADTAILSQDQLALSSFSIESKGDLLDKQQASFQQPAILFAAQLHKAVMPSGLGTKKVSDVCDLPTGEHFSTKSFLQTPKKKMLSLDKKFNAPNKLATQTRYKGDLLLVQSSVEQLSAPASPILKNRNQYLRSEKRQQSSHDSRNKRDGSRRSSAMERNVQFSKLIMEVLNKSSLETFTASNSSRGNSNLYSHRRSNRSSQQKKEEEEELMLKWSKRIVVTHTVRKLKEEKNKLLGIPSTLSCPRAKKYAKKTRAQKMRQRREEEQMIRNYLSPQQPTAAQLQQEFMLRLNNSIQKEPFSPKPFHMETNKPIFAGKKTSVPCSDKSVTFISDYKKRRAQKVMLVQKKRVGELLCTFKVVQDDKSKDTSGDKNNKISSKTDIVYDDLVFTDTLRQLRKLRKSQQLEMHISGSEEQAEHGRKRDSLVGLRLIVEQDNQLNFNQNDPKAATQQELISSFKLGPQNPRKNQKATFTLSRAVNSFQKPSKEKTTQLVTQAMQCIRSKIIDTQVQTKQLLKEGAAFAEQHKKHFQSYEATQQHPVQKLINSLHDVCERITSHKEKEDFFK